MIKIAPSLLASDFTNIVGEIKKIEAAGADILHLDVMDGHFVPNLTFGLPIISQIKKICRLPLDVHLMVTNPEDYLEPLAAMGIEYISIHQETVLHLHRQVSVIKANGCKAGIALNPATPVETIYPLLPDLDFVLLMSVNPGFGGQKFLPLVYDKIKKIREFARHNQLNLEIEVDGGVNELIAPKLIAAGADILVAGSYIFRQVDYQAQIDSLRQ
ncbi:MAG: ribulose-phosphate 3-epimerase [Candidatus Cloacimonadales bacterium]